MQRKKEQPNKKNRPVRVVAEAKAKYKVRRATPSYDTRPIVKRELPRAIERIVNALHPEKIILFGSFASGKPTPDSDVDLMVVMETTARPVERAVEVGRQLIPRVFPVDIIVKTPDEIEHALKSGDFFIEEIVAQGKVLYERRN